MVKSKAAEVSPSGLRETRSAACLFSIFKVPSLLLRDATVGEVRKWRNKSRIGCCIYLHVKEITITHGVNQAFLISFRVCCSIYIDCVVFFFKKNLPRGSPVLINRTYDYIHFHKYT